MTILAWLMAAHLFGDFPLQNHWMQQKAKSSFVCTIHVLMYSLPFVGLMVWFDLPAVLIAAILIQHWLQDRFALHMKWMTIYRQTTPDLWPVGPLCVDQAWHVSFIAVFVLLFA